MSGTMLNCIPFSPIKYFPLYFVGHFYPKEFIKNPEHYCNNVEGNGTEQNDNCLP